MGTLLLVPAAAPPVVLAAPPVLLERARVDTLHASEAADSSTRAPQRIYSWQGAPPGNQWYNRPLRDYRQPPPAPAAGGDGWRDDEATWYLSIPIYLNAAYGAGPWGGWLAGPLCMRVAWGPDGYRGRWDLGSGAGCCPEPVAWAAGRRPARALARREAWCGWSDWVRGQQRGR